MGRGSPAHDLPAAGSLPPCGTSDAESRERSAAVLRLARRIGTTFELHELFSDVCDVLGRVLGSSATAVIQCDGDLRTSSAPGCDPALVARLAKLPPPGDEVCAYLLGAAAIVVDHGVISMAGALPDDPSARIPLHGVPDASGPVGRWLQWLRDLVAVPSFVALPLRRSEHLLGILVTTREHGQPWTVEDLVFIETVGSHIELAVHYLAVSAESQRWATQLGLVQSAMSRLNRLNTVESVGQAIVEETQRVVDYHNCRVYLLEPPDVLLPVAVRGDFGLYRDIPTDLLQTRIGQGLTGWVAQHNQGLIVHDAESDPRANTIPGTEPVDESMVVVPMRFEDEVLGVITLSKLGLRQFDDRDLRLMGVLADAAATAFQSARAQHGAERRERDLRSLVELSTAVSQTLDPMLVADLIASHAGKSLDADYVTASSWERATGILRRLSTQPPLELESVTDYDLRDYPESLRCMEERRPILVTVGDPASHPTEIRYLEGFDLKQNLMVPLVVKGAAIGLLEFATREIRRVDDEMIEFATAIANEAAMALDNARLYDQARRLADHDPLTNFFNHRYLHERLGEEVLRARRTRRPLSMLMIDLDDFKLVNDTLGHQWGDQVLRWAADLIHSTLRESDVAARYGGDEFAVILPEADCAAARAAAERIQAAFASHAFLLSGRAEIPIGASIGIADFPGHARTAGELIAVADAEMFRAKRAGGRLAAEDRQPDDDDGFGGEMPGTGQDRDGQALSGDPNRVSDGRRGASVAAASTGRASDDPGGMREGRDADSRPGHWHG